VGHHAHPDAEHDVDGRDHEDQPEMTDRVLPPHVGRGLGEEQPEPSHRYRQMQHPDDRADRLHGRRQVRAGRLRHHAATLRPPYTRFLS
jgi:hypothetical protein